MNAHHDQHSPVIVWGVTKYTGSAGLPGTCKLLSWQIKNVLGCPWKLVTIVSKLGYNLLTGRIQPTFIGVVIHLLSTMDILVAQMFLFQMKHAHPPTLFNKP